MEGTQAAGRYFEKPMVSSLTSPNGLWLRLDDEDDEEMWVEITIPADLLLKLAAEVQAMKQKAEGGAS